MQASDPFLARQWLALTQGIEADHEMADRTLLLMQASHVALERAIEQVRMLRAGEPLFDVRIAKFDALLRR
ncbi:hypothetical protein [Rhodoligotrophos ferricapiens]|uniref:hypothetical protein n=1 Tax=Rhodoligotrophos ferricapiens TaxID=3069264 RepID=UPI00315C68E5